MAPMTKQRDTVAEVKTTLQNSPPQLMIGLPDQYDKGGEYHDILERHGLTSQLIAERVESQLKRNSYA